jgi:EAL domain-containing protein (putative c-di-GMP-specific phosphodiesterase class I)
MQSLANTKNLKEHISYNKSGQCVGHYRGTQLQSVFQPIIDSNKNTIGYEALVRITTKSGQTLRPDLFFNAPSIPLLDKLNVDALSRAVHIYNFSKSNQNGHQLFLNMIPQSSLLCAEDKYVRQQLLELLDSTKIDANRVVVELLESKTCSNVRLSRATENLNQSGFTIAIDDYGVEYSTEERANNVKPAILKIDRSLLNQYFSGLKKPLLKAIQLAKNLNAKTVIEGIENKQQLNEMEDLGIDMFQGYYLAIPQPLPSKSSLVPMKAKA